jgi:hypothetical protein
MRNSNVEIKEEKKEENVKKGKWINVNSLSIIYGQTLTIIISVCCSEKVSFLFVINVKKKRKCMCQLCSPKLHICIIA